MEHLTRAVQDAVGQRNWYAALTLALALPDIAGWLEDPSAGSMRRYVRWCGDYLAPKYTSLLGPGRKEHVFLGGEDCYALRCAFLHEGGDDVTQQRARKALEQFLFIAPPKDGGTIHCNQSNDLLQLQVDIFCTDVCDGVREWQSGQGARPEVSDRSSRLLRIAIPESGLSF